MDAGYTRVVDWWTLGANCPELEGSIRLTRRSGVLLYEMLSGLPPFFEEGAHFRCFVRIAANE